MDTSIIFTALIVSVFAPVILAMLTGYQTRSNKKQDWARQDELAERAEKAAEVRAKKTADELRRASEHTAQLVEEVRVTAETSQAATDSKLDEIHTLVNGEMTAARTELLGSTRLTLRTLRKIVDQEREAGREPNPEDLAEITSTENRIDELEAILKDRSIQQAQIDAKREQQKKDH